MIAIGIVGASGFTGAELLRLCAGHPEYDVAIATGDTQAGTTVGDLYPSLAAAYPELRFSPYSPEAIDGLDLVFCGLPHGRSQALMPELRDRVKHVVDLAADFRLRNPALYPRWYGEEHTARKLNEAPRTACPNCSGRTSAAMPTFAAAGCYPTAAALALVPLVRAGLIGTDGIVVDSGQRRVRRRRTGWSLFSATDQPSNSALLLVPGNDSRCGTQASLNAATNAVPSARSGAVTLADGVSSASTGAPSSAVIASVSQRISGNAPR